MKKRCCSCEQFKNKKFFSFKNKQKGIRNTECKSCKTKYNKKWYKKNKDNHIINASKNKKRYRYENLIYVLNYLKEHPCINCGESDPVVLDFDHLQDKKYNVSEMIGAFSLKSVIKEINKCQVLCANCHRRKTAKDQNWYNIVSNASVPDGVSTSENRNGIDESSSLSRGAKEL